MDAAEELTLRDRIQSLAQELQDMILDFTIAIEPTTVHVTPAYKKPWQLNINRATRKTVAEVYYKRCTFVWRSDAEEDMYIRWLKSLPDDHHAMIRKIRFWAHSIDGLELTPRPFKLEYACIYLRRMCFPIAAQAGKLLPRDVFWTNINSFDEAENDHQIWLQLQTIHEMWQDPYWTAPEQFVHSWKDPPMGCSWDRSY